MSLVGEVIGGAYRVTDEIAWAGPDGTPIAGLGGALTPALPPFDG